MTTSFKIEGRLLVGKGLKKKSKKLSNDLFNRSLATCFFPDWSKLSFGTPIFKSDRCNDRSKDSGIAILSAIVKLFKLLVHRVMYEDLKGCLADYQHGFVKGRSTVSNLFEYSFFVLKSIEDGWQVGLSKAFDRVRHCLPLACPLSVVAFLLFW
jgi:hypothetical protein